jgi:heptosyltransferase-1
MFFLNKEINAVTIIMPEKHMGNVVISLPSILSIVNFFRGVDISITVDERYVDIVKAFVQDISIIPYPRALIKGGLFHEKLRSLYLIIKYLRGKKPDITFDLEGRTVGPVQSLFSGSKIKIGFESSDKSFIYNIRVPSPKNIHKSRHYLSIPQFLGFDTEVILKARIKELWIKKLTEKIDINDKIISIHPSAGKIYKKWPHSKFVKVADYFSKNGYKICFIGSSNDKTDIYKIKEKMKEKAIDLSGILTIGELIALFSLSSLFIGNDSGPMHLSSLIGTPTIGLFGAADERRWAPMGKRSTVIRGSVRCKKCSGKDCAHGFKCINDIEVEKVIINAEHFLNKKQ